MRPVPADSQIALSDLLVGKAGEPAGEFINQKFSFDFDVRLFHDGVPGRGLEPLRIAPPDPKSGASANFATLAVEPATAATIDHYRRTLSCPVWPAIAESEEAAARP